MGTINSKINWTKSNLKTAQALGACYATKISFKSICGEEISDSELQRVLSYNEIKYLNEEEINSKNISLVEESIKWSAWIPKTRYVEKTEGCRYSKFFPDGSKEFIRIDFRK